MLSLALLLLAYDNAGPPGQTSWLHPTLAYSCACILAFLSASWALYRLARHTGLDRITSSLLLASLPYFLYWMNFHHYSIYTNDLPGHMSYMLYVSENWNDIYGYWGNEYFQPPPYYMLCALLIQMASHLPDLQPMTIVRLLSLGFYLAFCLYGVHTLRKSVVRENLLYYAGVALIVFWPVSILMATRINNDIAVYAPWAAMFYYLIHWHEDGDLPSLHRAMICTGIAFLFKSNAVIPLAILGACILLALCNSRLRLRDLRSRKSLMAFAALGLGILINAGKAIRESIIHSPEIVNAHFGLSSTENPTLSYFLSFHLEQYLRHPFNIRFQEPDFLSQFLKTMLYGEFTWAHTQFATALNLLLLLFLCATCCACLIALRARKESLASLAPHLLAIALPLGAIITFYVIKRWMVCEDFRFVLPMLVPLVILFVRSTEALRSLPKAKPLYYFCLTTALTLPTASTVFYLAHYLL